MCRRSAKRTQDRAQHGGRWRGGSCRSVARSLSVQQAFVGRGLVTLAVDDLRTDRGWNPIYEVLSVIALLPLMIQRIIHTERVYQKAVVSKPLGVQTSSQLGYRDDSCPTVVDSEKGAYTAIERRGPTDEFPEVLHGRNEAVTDYGCSTAGACKHLACSCWDDRHSMHHFEVYSYRRRPAS